MSWLKLRLDKQENARKSGETLRNKRHPHTRDQQKAYLSPQNKVNWCIGLSHTEVNVDTVVKVRLQYI